MRKFEYTADSVVGLPLKSNISHHDLKAQFEFDEDFFTTWMSWPFVMALLAKTALMAPQSGSSQCFFSWFTLMSWIGILNTNTIRVWCTQWRTTE
ncbi:hypothetical protein GLYMA_13G200700v4 [Glycine max]|uniref:Uncharacterized protein n=1 Tax=Glycine max TaxID=3847 RepID=K7M0S9_SOYBN|nr:hypothetical protein JHK85_037523 [Glycine max]KAG4977501.1 hypothetical protein JHK86_036975 [Glycine max]KAH1102427.1 hypothetical protein GYH30_036796 [Glycine max]KRH20789.1 hypothetical protein GLYMA_13G200700v4 [Glycine max]